MEGAAERSVEARSSRLARVLDNRTGPQRVVISLGALATALLAIGALVVAVASLLGRIGGDDRPDLGERPTAVQRIAGGTAEADAFVHALLDREGGVVELDHQIEGETTAADAHLLYDCSDGGACHMVRIQDGQVAGSSIEGGWWFQGCFRVVPDGLGYGADTLDILLDYQSETCPDE